MKNQRNVIKAFDFIESLEQHEDLDQAVECFSKFIQDMGWTSFTLGELVNPRSEDEYQPLGMSFYPEEWQNRWLEKDYILNDPCVLEVLRRKLPFFWHEVRPNQAGICAKIMDEGQEFEFFDGFCVPIKTPHGPPATITLAGDRSSRSDEDRLSLHLVCVYFFAKVESLVRSQGMAHKPLLSERERECLHWVSSGKSDWEMGMILSISQHTVRSHVQSAMKKMGATTRTQTIALALRHGEIVP